MVPAPPKKERLSFNLMFTYGLWFIILYDPQFLAAFYGARFLLNVPTIFYGIYLVITLAKKPEKWVKPMLVLTLFVIFSMAVSWNKGYAERAVKNLSVYYILAIGTVKFVDTPAKLLPILTMYLWQTAWWGAFANVKGLVPWHPTLSNYDGYGPLMVILMAYSYFYGLATKVKKMRILTFLLLTVCILGIVASIARGAVLASGLVMFLMWFRSPRKGRTTAFAAVAVVLLMVFANVLFPDGAFWKEINSSFTEGKDQGTGKDRWALWNAAVKVWKLRPAIGVGPNCFGVAAAENFRPGDVGADYSDNPLVLYDRRLHSIYMQTLAEGGLVGAGIFLWLIWDCWKRGRRLRTRARRDVWAASVPHLDLRVLSYGLEAIIIAYLASGFFYDQLYMHWFYTAIILTYTLQSVSEPPRTLSAGQLRALRTR